MPIIPRTSMGLAMRATWASKGWRASCPLRLLMTSEGSDDADEAGSSTYEPSVAHRVSRGWMLQRDMGGRWGSSAMCEPAQRSGVRLTPIRKDQRNTTFSLLSLLCCQVSPTPESDRGYRRIPVSRIRSVIYTTERIQVSRSIPAKTSKIFYMSPTAHRAGKFRLHLQASQRLSNRSCYPVSPLHMSAHNREGRHRRRPSEIAQLAGDGVGEDWVGDDVLVALSF